MLDTIKINNINNIIPVNISLGNEDKELVAFSNGTINGCNSLNNKEGIEEK